MAMGAFLGKDKGDHHTSAPCQREDGGSTPPPHTSLLGLGLSLPGQGRAGGLRMTPLPSPHPPTRATMPAFQAAAKVLQ